MNSFTSAKDVEAEALLVLLPYLERRRGVDVHPELTKGQLHLQSQYGDIVTPTTDGARVIELKAEKANEHGNLFLETWSNRAYWTLGWMYKTQCHWLWYFFVEEGALYQVDMMSLKRWAFGHGSERGRIYRYPEKLQKRYEQLNDTWGRCVPIEDLHGQVESFEGPIHP